MTRLSLTIATVLAGLATAAAADTPGCTDLNDDGTISVAEFLVLDGGDDGKNALVAVGHLNAAGDAGAFSAF